VDDEVAIVAFIAEVLAEEGYQVHVAYNSLDGLLAIVAHRPDLVLLDLLMPLMQGQTVLAAIRERGRDVPVVAISANQIDLAGLAEQGVTATLAKPFTLDELSACLARNIRS
jgi:CheY-like chemotaxis protein